MLARNTIKNRTTVPGVPTGADEVPKPVPVTFTLPAPPSTNALFKDTVKGRAPTAQYQDWKMQAATAIRMQCVQKVAGRVIILIGVERHSSQADIDNRIKATQDALVKADIIDDDRFVTAAFAFWSPKANHLAHVAIYPCQRMTLTFHPSHDGASGALVVDAPQLENGEDHADFTR
jgi:Holliday junction resolvase RusA-like endonuclease